MSGIDVDDRIRHALADLAATTTTSPDARERIAERARPRGSRVRVALLAAAGLAVIVTGLVFVAVVLRGPASTDDDLRGPATATTPATTLPDGTNAFRISGEDGGIAWTLEALRFPGGRVRVEAHGDDGTIVFDNPTPDRVHAAALAGGGGPVRLVAGVTPPSAATARITLPDGTVVPVDVLGDGDGIGVRLFVTTVPAGAAEGATVEVFAADGTLLGTSSL